MDWRLRSSRFDGLPANHSANDVAGFQQQAPASTALVSSGDTEEDIMFAKHSADGPAHGTTWTLAIVRVWFVATMVAAFSSPPLQAQGPPVDRAAGPKLNTEIVSAVEMYRRAALAGDARAVAAIYTEDAVELPNCEPLVRGRAAIEQRYRKFFDGPVKRTSFTFSHLEATIEGNVGYAVGTYNQRLALPTGQTVSDTGKYLVILRRTQGEWKAMYAIWNGDTLPPPGGNSPERPRL
jgi:uncharacterized protein (TIGR02246 family)